MWRGGGNGVQRSHNDLKTEEVVNCKTANGRAILIIIFLVTLKDFLVGIQFFHQFLPPGIVHVPFFTLGIAYVLSGVKRK